MQPLSHQRTTLRSEPQLPSGTRPGAQNARNITKPISLMFVGIFRKWLCIFHEHSARCLGVKEANHARQSSPRFLIDQLDSLGLRPVEFPFDVLGLETHMMESAAPPGEELAHPVVGTQRLE